MSGVSDAGSLNVAVASNFYPTAKTLVSYYRQHTGDDIRLIHGSSGKLYAQIRHGAPIDLFLSADTTKPQQLIKDELADPESFYIYAQGRLALYSRKFKVAGDLKRALFSDDIGVLAMANPQIAPYGLAAQQTLSQLGIKRGPKQKWLLAENVAQAQMFVETLTADAGLVAYSMLIDKPPVPHGYIQPIDTRLHSPINQALVILHRANQADAQRLVGFIRSAQGQTLIRQAGYQVEQRTDDPR